MVKRFADPEVHKFGGASLADANAVKRALAIIASRTTPSVIVVSALAGVTDTLLSLAAAALAGKRGDPTGAADAARVRHRAVVTAVIPTARGRKDIMAAIDGSFDELRVLMDGVASLRELTLRTNDLIVARGERLSAMIVAAGLNALGKKAQYVDATDIIVTDG
ncbi:MAG: lysine-sensitive aspartokinase 3, partial [Gemmatimonadaceae bacterium]